MLSITLNVDMAPRMLKKKIQSLNWFFDFEAWACLARERPDDFEKERKALIEAYIDGSPAKTQQRLRSLQWRIDMERRRAPDSLTACVRIYHMMWESFAGEHGLADALKRPREVVLARSARPEAKVLHLKTPRED